MYNVRCYFLNSFHQLLFLVIASIASFAYQASWARTDHPEVQRVRSFDDYKKQKRLEEREREKGMSVHLEKIEMEKREYELALEEYRKQKRKEKPLELTEVYSENVQERREEKRKKIKEYEEFIAEKKVEKRLLENAQINKLEELGLPEDRPRFDVKKRVLYGASSHFGKTPVSSGGGGNSYSPADSGGNDFAAPAPFDEFPPPPTFPEDSFDIPPPPPPMPYDDGMGMSNPTFDEFPPPPPPPDDFQF